MRITESQLRRVVKRLIREQSDEAPVKFTMDLSMSEFASMNPPGLTDMILAGQFSPWQKFSGDRPVPADVEITKKSSDKITLEFSFRDLEQAFDWYKSFTKRTGRPFNPQTLQAGLDPASRSSFDPSSMKGNLSQPTQVDIRDDLSDIEDDIENQMGVMGLKPSMKTSVNLKNVLAAAKALGHTDLPQEFLVQMAENWTDLAHEMDY